ncbi:MAG: hypothetical protein N4A62_16265 [Marinisporobacter sp.]|nr:hypothetical protein [Marinisporobacter sp.]
MLNKDISPILNQFFIREFQQLMDKYNSGSEEDTKHIEILLGLTEEIQGKEYIFQDFNRALVLARKYTEDNIEELELYLWVNNHLEEMQIQEINPYYEEFTDTGYVRVKDILIYREGASLERFTEDALDEMLQDRDEIDKLFDKDEIIEMWMEETSKKKAIRGLMSTENYEELLGIDPERAYESVSRDTIMYAELDC